MAQSLHMLAEEIGINSTQGNGCHHLESEEKKGAYNRTLGNSSGLGAEGGRKASQGGAGTGVQEKPKSEARQRN